MTITLRIILFGLLLLLLGLKPVLGGDTIGGGDGGIIILPSAVSVSVLRSLEEPRQTVAIAVASSNLTLQLPANMGDSFAILSLPDDESSTILMLRDSRLYLSGADLMSIKASGVQSFVITILSSDGMALRIVYRFLAGNSASIAIY